MLAALSATKLVHGTRELIESIATQATLADIRLNSPVRRVVQNGEGCASNSPAATPSTHPPH